MIGKIIEIIGVTIGVLILAGLTYILFHKPEWENNTRDDVDLHLSSFSYPIVMFVVIIYFVYTLPNSPINSLGDLFSEIVSTAYGELNMYNRFKECIKQGDDFIFYSLKSFRIMVMIFYYFASLILLNNYILVHRNSILDRMLCFLGDCLLQIFISFMFSTFTEEGSHYLAREGMEVFALSLALSIFILQSALIGVYFALVLSVALPLFWYQAIMGITIVELGIPEFMGQTLSILLTCCASIICERIYMRMLLPYNSETKKFDTKLRFSHVMVIFIFVAYITLIWFCFTVLKIQIPSTDAITGTIFRKCCGCR